MTSVCFFTQECERINDYYHEPCVLAVHTLTITALPVLVPYDIWYEKTTLMPVEWRRLEYHCHICWNTHGYTHWYTHQYTPYLVDESNDPPADPASLDPVTSAMSSYNNSQGGATVGAIPSSCAVRTQLLVGPHSHSSLGTRALFYSQVNLLVGILLVITNQASQMSYPNFVSQIHSWNLRK